MFDAHIEFTVVNRENALVVFDKLSTGGLDVFVPIVLLYKSEAADPLPPTRNMELRE